MESKDIVLVVAGNLDQFRNYGMKMGLLFGEAIHDMTRGRFYAGGKEYIYMMDADRMRGFHDVEVQFIGTWNHRPDAHKLNEMASQIRER